MSPKVFVSLCLNVGLGVLYFLITQTGAEVRPEQPASAKSSFSKKPAGPPIVTITNVVKTEFKWSQLETQDYKEYVQRLRAVGCPESTLRDIILADLDNVYEPKLNELRGLKSSEESVRYWVYAKPAAANPRPETSEAITALRAERAALVVELLGVTEKSIRAQYDRHDDSTQSRYAFLGEEKRDQLIKLEKRFDLYPADETAGEGRLLHWRPDLSPEKYQEMRAALAEFMTPEEIREYDLRTSKHARYMTLDFRTIEINEAEFRSMFAPYQSWSEARNKIYDIQNPPTPEQKAEADQMEKQAVEQMKGILGAERYKEFRLYRDMAYTDLIEAAPYLGFNREAARKVVDMRVEVNKAVAAIKGNEALSETDRAQALLEIRLATEQAVTQTIGEKGYNYYRRQGGRWINGISPSTAKP